MYSYFIELCNLSVVRVWGHGFLFKLQMFFFLLSFEVIDFPLFRLSSRFFNSIQGISASAA